jgi:hypothetical protein
MSQYLWTNIREAMTAKWRSAHAALLLAMCLLVHAYSRSLAP